MPKIKTHRGAAKRFSLTKNGKIKSKAAIAPTLRCVSMSVRQDNKKYQDCRFADFYVRCRRLHKLRATAPASAPPAACR